MTRSLQSLLEHAERQRDESLALVQHAEATARHAHQQWDQLHSYRADTEARAPGHGGRAAAIELLHCHRAFTQRLDQALAQQRAALQSAEQALQLQRQTLLQRETRVAAVRKLIERRLAEQQRGHARLEQNRSDEAATQRRWRDSANSPEAVF
ncbi:MAG: flagellar export protein FliJ [Rubrivivax sp.]|nr:flagellar export protein FliJ [Rubrivivax sp.]MDP3610642.1 flagellar export protein FliJ [Rubrivivax sp.]